MRHSRTKYYFHRSSKGIIRNKGVCNCILKLYCILLVSHQSNPLLTPDVYCGTCLRSGISEPLKIRTNAFVYQRIGKYRNYRKGKCNLIFVTVELFFVMSLPVNCFYIFSGAKNSLPFSSNFISRPLFLKVLSHIQIKKPWKIFTDGQVNFKRAIFKENLIPKSNFRKERLYHARRCFPFET